MHGRPRNVLILFDERALATQIVVDHLEAFRRHSEHRIFYYSCRRPATPAIRAEAFDAIIIHFSARLPFEGVIHASIVEALAVSRSLKIAMPQDEYDMPFVAARKMRAMGVDLVFTTVPAEWRADFYPPDLIGPVEYFDNLTGYVPEPLLTAPRKPHAERPYAMVYRGNELPPWYGILGREKYEIGVRMKAALDSSGLANDIESGVAERIYGSAWADFLAGGRTMCASESGCNVLDGDGTATRAAQRAQADDPGLGWEALYERYIRVLDDRVRMNQVSPKIFEAIALETGLVLFEGEWSGILEPDRHYIPLKKNFSNLDQVIARLLELPAVEAMAKRAYAEVGLNPAYRYDALVRRVDACVSRGAGRIGARNMDWTGAMTAVWNDGGLVKLSPEAMPLMQPWSLPGRSSDARGPGALEVLLQLIEDSRTATPRYQLHSRALLQGLAWFGRAPGRAEAEAAVRAYQDNCDALAARIEVIAQEAEAEGIRSTNELVRDRDLLAFCELRSNELRGGVETLNRDFEAISRLIRELRKSRPVHALASRVVGYVHRKASERSARRALQESVIANPEAGH